MKIDTKISLLIEGYPRTGYQTYSKIVGKSTSGLVFTRLHPDYVAQKYDLARSRRYWLSGNKGADNISPKSLKQLVKTIRTELRGRSGGTVFLDGLEYLLIYNDISKVLSTLEEIDKVLRMAEVELIVSIDPLTFEQRDIDTLWAAFPRFTTEEMLLKHSIGQSLNIGEGGRVSAGPETAGLKV